MNRLPPPLKKNKNPKMLIRFNANRNMTLIWGLPKTEVPALAGRTYDKQGLEV